MKSKDNQLAHPDYGFQVDLMTASGIFMAPYVQNLCRISSSGVQYLTLLRPFGKEYSACLQGLCNIVNAFQ